MKITRKDIMKAVSESIKGFRPGNMATSAPKPMDNSAVSKTPSQPVDYDKVELVHDPKLRSGAEWAKYGGNFPVKRNGDILQINDVGQFSAPLLRFV